MCFRLLNDTHDAASAAIGRDKAYELVCAVVTVTSIQADGKCASR
jgi:hypothetical protein